jgi:Mce-associated membrane protein
MTSIVAPPAALRRTSLRGPLRMAILALAVVAVVAFAAAGWFGVSWYRTAHDNSLALGKDRDAVLRDAQLATFNLNTLDYHRVQDGLALWEHFAAGSLLTQLQANRSTYARAITDSATISTAKVLDAAVASLDERAGTALAFVAVDVTSQSEQGDPSCVHRRARLDMIRVGNAWKVGALAPVGDAYSEPGPCPPASSPR